MAEAYDRLKAALRAMVRELFPRLSYMGGYQYSVTACDYAAQTFDGEPVNSDLGLPALVKVPVRSPLLAVKLVPGQVVVVSFENYDPAYPYVSGLPSGGGSALPVVRQGDVCWVQIPLLVPAISPAGVPIPNTYCIFLDPSNPPPPPFVPATGGPVKLYGIASSGSLHVKAK